MSVNKRKKTLGEERAKRAKDRGSHSLLGLSSGSAAVLRNKYDCRGRLLDVRLAMEERYLPSRHTAQEGNYLEVGRDMG